MLGVFIIFFLISWVQLKQGIDLKLTLAYEAAQFAEIWKKQSYKTKEVIKKTEKTRTQNPNLLKNAVKTFIYIYNQLIQNLTFLQILK